MERDLKVLLTVDDNNYKITIKTRGFANAVPFSEFKHFLDDKHKQLFHDVNYVWKIYDADFGEFVTLENCSMIYDLSKIKAIRDENRLHGNANNNTGNFDNRNRHNYSVNHDYNQIPIERADMGVPQCPSQMDLRDFVAGSFRSAQQNITNPINMNTFDSYYPNRMPVAPQPVQNVMQPIYPRVDHPREIGYRRASPPRVPLDLNYSVSSNFGSSNYLPDSHRMSSTLCHPEVSHNRAFKKDSLLYRSMQSELYPNPSKRRKSPEPSQSSNRNRILSTPLYLKRTAAQEKKISSRPLTKLSKPSSPIRDRSKKISEVSKRIHQRIAATTTERKLPVKVTKPALSGKDTKSQKPTKQLPNCVKALDHKRRDYFKVEDKQLGKALIAAVKKYNDEFSTIAMCEDIWETSRIWTYIAKELSGASDVYLKPTRKAIRCRRYFRGMLRRYLIILEDFWNWSEFEAQELWPFFEFFHKQLDLTPFDKDIARLKECFTKKVKPMKQAKESKSKSDSESKSKKKEDKKQFLFDEKYDIRLLMAVSEHIDDFRKDTILESDVWTEVAVDLNDPPILDPTLLEKSRIKWETRFYLLLSEFQKLMKKEGPLTSSERTLKFLFDKLDITPFLKEENESGDDSASNGSYEELENEIPGDNAELITVEDEMVESENKNTNDKGAEQDEKIQDVHTESGDKKEFIEELTIDDNSQTESNDRMKIKMPETTNTEIETEKLESEATENRSADVENDEEKIGEEVISEPSNEIINLNEEFDNKKSAECDISNINNTGLEINEIGNSSSITDITLEDKQDEIENTENTIITELKKYENSSSTTPEIPCKNLKIDSDSIIETLTEDAKDVKKEKEVLKKDPFEQEQLDEENVVDSNEEVNVSESNLNKTKTKEIPGTGENLPGKHEEVEMILPD